MLFNVVGLPRHSPSPFSPAPFPHRAHKKGTLIDDTEILGVYGSSVPIHLINDPPRKKGEHVECWEVTYVGSVQKAQY